MTVKHLFLAATTLAALAAAPAFAQTTVQSGTTATVSSGTGVTVTSPNTGASVTVTPSTAVAVQSAHLMPGGVMLPAQSTTVLGGPAADVSGSQTVTTRYWTNVPANAQYRADFQRWQQLRD